MNPPPLDEADQREYAGLPMAGQEMLAPIYSHAAFQGLCDQLFRTACAGLDGRGQVLVDADTALALSRMRGTLPPDLQVRVAGDVPRGWQDHERLIQLDRGRTDDRYLIAAGPIICAAAVGRFLSVEGGGGVRFDGGWTPSVTHTEALWLRLVEELRLDNTPWPEPASDDLMRWSATIAAIVSGHARQFARPVGGAVGQRDLNAVLQILKAISLMRRSHDVLFVFAQQIARVVDVQRCSVVRVWADETQGTVLASHDDQDINDLGISLDRYPEISQVLRTGDPVVINDIIGNPITKPVADELAGAGFSSLLVVPIVLYDPKVGSLILRAARCKAPFTAREIGFCEVVAEAASSALERVHLLEQVQQANEQLEHLAVTDGLTGLYNHRFFRQRLEEEFDRSRRYKGPLSCIILDIDDFKKVNDTFGHLAGDSVLCQISQHVQGAIRKSDLLARYGGEEFTILMPQTPIEGAMIEAKRLREGLARERYEALPPGVTLTVSIGVAAIDLDDMKDPDALVQAADAALYEAKRTGKNRVVAAPAEGDHS